MAGGDVQTGELWGHQEGSGLPGAPGEGRPKPPKVAGTCIHIVCLCRCPKATVRPKERKQYLKSEDSDIFNAL